jgi:hypothetical protein
MSDTKYERPKPGTDLDKRAADCLAELERAHPSPSATARPWHAVGRCVYDTGGALVATCTGRNEPVGDRDWIHATMIARAANSHDSLIAVLDRIASGLRAYQCDGPREFLAMLEREARAALAEVQP